MNDHDDQVIKFGENGRFVAGRNDVLGQGGFGKVYHALDTQTLREVAVKIELSNLGTPTIPTESSVYKIIGPNCEYWAVYSSTVVWRSALTLSIWLLQVESRKSTTAVHPLMDQHTFWRCNFFKSLSQIYNPISTVNSHLKQCTC